MRRSPSSGSPRCRRVRTVAPWSAVSVISTVVDPGGTVGWPSAPRHDKAAGRFDHSIVTARNVLAVDIDPITPAGSRVELGADPHPLHETTAVGEVGKHDFRRSLDPLRNLDCAGQVFNHAVAAGSVRPV